VENNPHSLAAGRDHARRAGLADAIHFLQADATTFATYCDLTPADVVLLCGVWGHVPPHQRPALVRACQSLCKPSGVVIWTRGVRQGTERFEAIRALFANPLWEEIRAIISPDAKWAVATHRYLGPPTPLPLAGQIFQFQTVCGE
jgi:hypothetical protein